MPWFNYTAYDSSGSKIESQVEADDKSSVRTMLLSQQLHVVKVVPVTKSPSLSLSFMSDKLSVEELEFLTSELSILLESGVKIDKGLSILAKNHKTPAVDAFVSEVLNNLKQGKSVAEAFQTKQSAFDALYLNLISIGETTGRLPQVFSGLADDLKFRKDLKAKVTQALTYPSIILFVCISCILFVFNYIVPQMGSIFSEQEDLPIYTALLLGVSDWMQSYQWWLFMAIVGAGTAIFVNRDNRKLRHNIATKVLDIPVISGAVKQVESIRFNSAMSLMLDAGIKVDVAISHANKNIKNHVIQRSLNIAADKIRKGAPVATSLAQTPIFPGFYVSLLEVGEESGRLGTIFHEISMRAKSDFESWTTRITNMLEPILILVMGGIVGSVVVTMLLSVVSVNDVTL